MDQNFKEHDVSKWYDLINNANFYIAEIGLKYPIIKENLTIDCIYCYLSHYESEIRTFDYGLKGSITKPQIKCWPYVLIENLGFYNSSDDKEQYIQRINHEEISYISLNDNHGKIIHFVKND